MAQTISQTLGEFIDQVDARQLDSQVVEKTKLLFADWLASTLAGCDSDIAKIAFAGLNDDLLPGRCTIVGAWRRVAPLMAALVNGMMTHIWEFDDTHRNSLYHPGAVTIPAAVAAAEQRGVDGYDFLSGLIAGYEVGIRVADAINPAHYRYWHTTGTVGTFGAAAAAGRVMRLNRQQLAHALGNAGSQAAGLWQFQNDGAMTKPLHSGKAAMNGLLAAMLSAQGFTGAAEIFEGDQGFCRATASEYQLDAITADLGKRYRILEVTHKMYPSCGHTHTPIDAALALRDQLNAPSADALIRQLSRIQVMTNAVAIRVAGTRNPRTEYEAKFSIPYCVAHSLLYGAPLLNAFDAAVLRDPMIAQVMQKIELIVAPEFEQVFREKRPTEIRAELNDGQTARARVEYRRGDPENPAPLAAIRDKFLELARKTVSREMAEQLWDKCLSVDQARDMSRFWAD